MKQRPWRAVLIVLWSHSLLFAAPYSERTNSRWFDALRGADDRVALKLLRRGADINARDEWGWTPLMWASALGRPVLVRALIHAGADLDARDNVEKRTALMHAAAGEESLGVLRDLLRVRRAAHMEAPGPYGFESEACNGSLPTVETGRVESARLLLRAGADTEIKERRGTALLLATDRGATGMVRTLLEGKADMDAMESVYGQTAVVLAAYKGPPEILRLLLDEGADVSRLKDSCLEQAVRQNDIERARLLIHAGLDPSSRVARTCILDEAPTRRFTVLMTAAVAGFTDMVRTLVAAGADVNATAAATGLTALICAAKEGHNEAVKILLAAGANVDASDRRGWTAVREAAYRGYAEVVRSLLGGGVSASENFVYAFRPPHPEVVRAFIEAGADINVRDDRGETPLMWARGNSEIVELLLDAGADPNATTSEGKTALMMAMENWYEGMASTIHLLIAGGANPNARDHEGRTALWIAIKSVKIPRAAIALIDEGVDVNAPDATGMTPLEWATRYNYRQLEQALRTAGAR